MGRLLLNPHKVLLLNGSTNLRSQISLQKRIEPVVGGPALPSKYSTGLNRPQYSLEPGDSYIRR